MEALIKLMIIFCLLMFVWVLAEGAVNLFLMMLKAKGRGEK